MLRTILIEVVILKTPVLLRMARHNRHNPTLMFKHSDRNQTNQKARAACKRFACISTGRPRNLKHRMNRSATQRNYPVRMRYSDVENGSSNFFWCERPFHDVLRNVIVFVFQRAIFVTCQQREKPLLEFVLVGL